MTQLEACQIALECQEKVSNAVMDIFTVDVAMASGCILAGGAWSFGTTKRGVTVLPRKIRRNVIQLAAKTETRNVGKIDKI